MQKQDSEKADHVPVKKLLKEMDRLIEGGQTLMVGATNHLEKVDMAFRRHGRYSVRVGVQSEGALGAL